ELLPLRVHDDVQARLRSLRFALADCCTRTPGNLTFAGTLQFVAACGNSFGRTSNLRAEVRLLPGPSRTTPGSCLRALPRDRPPASRRGRGSRPTRPPRGKRGGEAGGPDDDGRAEGAPEVEREDAPKAAVVGGVEVDPEAHDPARDEHQHH